jgi:hypothetical protein
MADTISASDIADFLTNKAWVAHSTYHTVLNPHQVQQFLDGMCCLISLSSLTGQK